MHCDPWPLTHAINTPTRSATGTPNDLRLRDAAYSRIYAHRDGKVVELPR
eukprot:COSAG02_NODE_5862_length_3980_cov_8.909302_1_plen_50_part_00